MLETESHWQKRHVDSYFCSYYNLTVDVMVYDGTVTDSVLCAALTHSLFWDMQSVASF